MKSTPIVLDHMNDITLDPSDPPFNNYQAFAANYEGLKILAASVRELEIQYAASDPHAAHVVLHMTSCRIPDDCIDEKRYPLFMARAVMRELIESLQSNPGESPC